MLVILAFAVFPCQSAEAKWGFGGKQEDAGSLGSSRPVTMDMLGLKSASGTLGSSRPVSLERLGVKNLSQVKIINKDPGATGSIDTNPLVPAASKDVQAILHSADGKQQALAPIVQEQSVQAQTGRGRIGDSQHTTITTVNPFDDLPKIDGRPDSVRRITTSPANPPGLDEDMIDSGPLDMLPGADGQMPVLPDLRKQGSFHLPHAPSLHAAALTSHLPFAKKVQTKLQTYRNQRRQRAMFGDNRAILKKRGF